MRGLCRLTAGAFFFACARTFVLPTDAAAEGLQQAIQDELAPDQAEPVLPDAVRLAVEAIDTPEFDPHIAQAPLHQDQEEEDRILDWLEYVEDRRSSTGSIFTASLYPTTTLSSAIEWATPVTSADQIDVTPSATRDHLPSSPEPTPLRWQSGGSDQQRPMGLAETWRLAKIKAQSVVAIIASHITDCPSRQKTASEGHYRHISTSSTISARTVEVTPTPASKVAVLIDHGRSSVAVAAEPSGVVDSIESDSEPTPISIVEALPTADWGKASPAQFAAPTGVSRPTNVTRAEPTTTTTAIPILDQSKLDLEDNGPQGDQPASVPFSKPDPRYVIAIVVPIITVFIISFIILKIYFRDPRRRAERRAWKEERNNRRLYRRAACEYKLQAWKQSIISRPPLSWLIPRSVEDLAEKGLIDTRPRDPIVASTISREIQSFKEAHDFVDTILHAEAGRWPSQGRRHTYMWLFGRRLRRQRALSNASSDLSDSEKSAPPPYEEHERYEKIELGREDAQDSDKSSVSSMIPTSTRHSLQTFSTGDPDSDKE